MINPNPNAMMPNVEDQLVLKGDGKSFSWGKNVYEEEFTVQVVEIKESGIVLDFTQTPYRHLSNVVLGKCLYEIPLPIKESYCWKLIRKVKQKCPECKNLLENWES